MKGGGGVDRSGRKWEGRRQRGWELAEGGTSAAAWTAVEGTAKGGDSVGRGSGSGRVFRRDLNSGQDQGRLQEIGIQTLDIYIWTNEVKHH